MRVLFDILNFLFPVLFYFKFSLMILFFVEFYFPVLKCIHYFIQLLICIFIVCIMAFIHMLLKVFGCIHNCCLKSLFCASAKLPFSGPVIVGYWYLGSLCLCFYLHLCWDLGICSTVFEVFFGVDIWSCLCWSVVCPLGCCYSES